MRGIDLYGMGTRTGSSFPEKLGTNNFVSKLVLFNNSSYNLHSFAWELVHLKKKVPDQR